MNSFGYLNAEIYPLIPFYGACVGVFVLIGAVWAFLCYRHQDQVITLHHFISIILAFQLVQAIFTLVEYQFQNEMGKLYFSYVVVNICFNSVRNALARILTLVVAMGYGILVSSILSQACKLAILTVIYVASNIAYLVAVQINRTQPISPTA